MSTGYIKTKSWTTKKLRIHKKQEANQTLQMLTCYDYQSAQMLNETELDLILVGDSLGNVILGFENTLSVTIEHMKIFCSAVKRGAPNKFVIGDLPFGTYSTFEDGIKNATDLFASSLIQAVKIEGAFAHHIELIKRLTQTGIPVMGHIGLTPQSVHELGGYYTHGKNKSSENKLIKEAKDLEQAGCFAIVLECVMEDVSKKITDSISIPTIGIGSGRDTDGQVLVLNDLLKLSKEQPPKFCTPITDLYKYKQELINNYLNNNKIGEKKNTHEEFSLN